MSVSPPELPGGVARGRLATGVWAGVCLTRCAPHAFSWVWHMC